MGGYSPPWPQEEKDRVRALVAEGNSSKEISEIVGRTARAVILGVARYELGPWPSLEQREMPEGFAEDALYMGIRKLSEKYHLGVVNIERFRKELGITKVMRKPKDPSLKKLKAPRKPRPSRAKKVAKEAFVRAVPEKPKHGLKEKYKTHLTNYCVRDTSPTGEAQHILQGEGWIVYRCNLEGKADIAGKRWRCGRDVITDQQLIDFAAGKPERDARRARLAQARAA